MRYLVALLLVLTLMLPSAPASAQSVSLSLTPSATSVYVGNTFTVTIDINQGSQSIQLVDVYVAFDPARLQVVDQDAGWSGVQIAPVSGPFYNAGSSGTCNGGSCNTANNSTGIIYYNGFNLPYGTTTAGTVATITFQAIQDTPRAVTQITILNASPYDSGTYYNGNDYLTSIISTSVNVHY